MGMNFRRQNRDSIGWIVLLLIASSSVIAGSLEQESESQADINRALYYERAKDYERAFELYMRYEEENPCAAQALRGLSRTAKRAGQLDRYREILRGRFSQYPENQLVAKQYIESLYKSGNVAECLAVGTESLRRWPEMTELYRNLSTLYRSNGLREQAVRVLRQGRRNLKKEDLFQREMAELLLLTGDYASSTEEFLQFLKTHPKSVTYVQRRLLEAGKASRDTSQILKLVREAESKEPCGWVLPLLIDLEIACGKYERALSLITNCSEGRDPNEGLKELIRLARLSVRQGLFEITERALDEAIGFSASARTDVKIQLASELKEMGRGEEALFLFESMVTENLSQANRIKCYESIGDLYLYFRKEPSQALNWYRKLDEIGVPPQHTAMLSLKVSRAMIAAGDLESAVTELLLLEESQAKGKIREEIIFELGNVHFYRGNLEDAMRYYRNLAESAPSFEETSEALEILRLDKRFGSEEAKALRLLGTAKYAERRAEKTIARDAYAKSVASAKDKILKDEIMLILAASLKSWGDESEALAIFEDLSEHAHQEYVAARALMEVGKMQYSLLGDWKAARETFERLILEYGAVIETEEARHLLAKIGDRPWD
ncbi:MAG: tetratricopeptide repeat protein [Candidatus Glassbacteria bacterium]